MTTITTLIIADDHPIFLQGLSILLDRLEWLELLGVASDGQEILETIEQHQPNIALIALSMFGSSTEQILNFAQKNSATTHLMALTMPDDEKKAQQLLPLGLSSYVLKDIVFEDLLAMIRLICTSDKLVLPSLIVPETTLANLNDLPLLTHRETEVLTYVAKGDRNKEIAYKLDITQRTVCFHMSNCFAKLDVSNRTQAIVKAASYGLVDIE